MLFSDISDSTAIANRLDPEEMRDIFSRIFSEISSVVRGYQGFIEKFVGDAVLAIFGLPTVHEDDPVRAVRAALDIHGIVRLISPEFQHRIERPLRMHSGLHTGLIVTGQMVVEKGIHGTVGDTLNIASRLASSSATDEIVMSPQTHRLVSSYFETKPLPPVKLKGIEKSVTPHLILGESGVKNRFEAARQKGFITFVGRRNELKKLKNCMDKTASGMGQFVTVKGEAGIGKSRLIYEFRNSLDRNKATFVQGRCQSYGRRIPYLPFINALQRGLSLQEGDTLLTLEQKVIRNILSIDSSLEQYLPQYLHILSIPSQTYPLPKAYHGQKLKSLINEALAAIILMNTTQNPLVMVLEDWHWVDEASHSALKYLESQMRDYALMLVVLFRPEDQIGWPRRKWHVDIVLRELDREHTAGIIQSIWHVRNLADKFVSLIHHRTSGNPYFIEEICKALTEEGVVEISNQRLLVAKPIENWTLPATVEAVIRSRLDRLDKQTKRTIQLAAVIGREFSLRILERIVGDQHQLSTSLELLEAQGLIQKSQKEPKTEYIFKHILTQVAVYESLLLKQRKDFHALVGETLLSLYGERIEEQCEKLAHHFVHSAEVKKALYYQEMAGDKAKSVHSLSEARQYYESAIATLQEEPLPNEDRQIFIPLSLKWAEVSQYTPSDKVRNTLIRSLDYALSFGEGKCVAEVNYWIAKISYMQGDFIEVIPRVEESIKWADKESDNELLGISFNLLGRACIYTSEYAQGIAYLKKGLRFIEPCRRWDDIVYSTSGLGLLFGLTGHYKKAMHHIAKSIQVARKIGIPTFEAMAFGYLGAVHFWFGNWRASVNNCRRCIKMSRKLENALPIIWATFFRGAARFNKEEKTDGLEDMEESLNLMARMESVLALRYFYSVFAECLALSGKYAQAESILQKAMSLSESGQKWGEIISYRTMGLLAAAKTKPDWHQTDTYLNKAISLSMRTGATAELVTCYHRFAHLKRNHGDTEGEQFYSRQARDLSVRISRSRSLL